MKEVKDLLFYEKIFSENQFSPLEGHLDLTYRCGFNCVHCYCQGLNHKGRELTASAWEKIIGNIKNSGCIFLVFSGGDPFSRQDFLKIYSYAKEKGFVITIFTNGYNLTQKIIDHLIQLPPFSIEITLNGITAKTYEQITRKKGSFNKVIDNIKKLKKAKLPLVLKTNCLKQNKHEIHKIKAFADKFLGKTKGRYHFKYDPMIYPRLNGDIAPTQYRLSFKELQGMRKQDKDMWRQFQKSLRLDIPELERDKKYLYQCNSWLNQFFVSPTGRIRFCEFSDKFSADLKKSGLKEAFCKIAPRILKEEFKTDSRCRDCRLRAICYTCPARAYLETGNEEAPVEFYCQLAQEAEKAGKVEENNAKEMR